MLPQTSWLFLLKMLRRSDDTCIPYSLIEDEGLDPGMLVREGLAEYGGVGTYRPADCHQDHLCELEFDLETKIDQGLIGVACPYEPGCWTGWDWVDVKHMQSLRCRAELILPALARLNGLEPIDFRVPTPFFPMGRLKRRGLDIPVVWDRSPGKNFDLLCQGLRRKLKGDGLLVVVGRPPYSEMGSGVADGVAVLPMSTAVDGKLPLLQGLDLLDPHYRSRALANSELDFDHLHLRFGTVPGERHQLSINGKPFGGFQKSDLRFLRLLRLALARILGKEDGWVDKSTLRSASERDREVEDVRKGFSEHPVEGVPAEELQALIRSRKREGLIRLGVPPENIYLDPSLADLALVTARQPKPTPAQRSGMQDAHLLLMDIQRLLVSLKN